MKKRIARHVTIVALSIGAGTLIALLVESSDLLFKVSMATAYVGMGLLSLTLLFGPWNVLRGRPNPVSTHLRRDVGIWAGLVALAHVLVGYQRHFPGNWLRWFRDSNVLGFAGFRMDAFGVASWTGLGAALLLGVLLVLSNDLSLRRLGTVGWKRWQRWNYAIFPLVLLHGLVFQALETRKGAWIVFTVLTALLVGVVQALGFRRRRARR